MVGWEVVLPNESSASESSARASSALDTLMDDVDIEDIARVTLPGGELVVGAGVGGGPT